MHFRSKYLQGDVKCLQLWDIQNWLFREPRTRVLMELDFACLGMLATRASYCWIWRIVGCIQKGISYVAKSWGHFPKQTVYTYSQLCWQAHEACGPMEIDSALSTVQTLKNELQDAKMAAMESQLKPLPGETVRGIGASCVVGLYVCYDMFRQF